MTDLKPDNIFLIAQDGQQDFVKIVDFGIATSRVAPSLAGPLEGMDAMFGQSQQALQQRHTMPGTVLGTPHYMAPEQALGEDVDPRADQYALGCILYEMLAGSVPFDDDSAASLMFKHAYRSPPELSKRMPESSLPASLNRLVMRTLAKKRDERFESMRALEQALLSELEQQSGKVETGLRAPSPELASAGPRGAAPLTERVVSARRTRLIVLVSVTLTVGLALCVGLLQAFFRRTAPAPEKAKWAGPQLLALRATALETLKRDLRHQDAELRQSAAIALGATYDRELTPALAALLDDKEPSVRIRAAEALGHLGQPSVVPRLAELLAPGREQPVVVVAAAEALDQLGDARGQKALRQALSGKHDAACIRAALYLCGHGDFEARKILSGAVEQGKVSEEGAIAILIRLAQAGDGAARDKLLTRLGSAENREVQFNLANLLGRIGEARGREFLREQAQRPGPQQLRAAALLAALDEPVDPTLFRRFVQNKKAGPAAELYAISGLGYVGAVSDLDVLQPLLQSSAEPRLRQMVAVAILRISDADPNLAAAQSLSWALEATSGPNWLLRDEAVAALEDLHSPAGYKALAGLLKRHDADPRLRRQAAQALGRQPNPEALRALRESVNDKDLGVQIAVRASLLMHGDESQRASLQSALQHDEETIRRLVIESSSRDRELLALALQDKSAPLRRLAARKLAALGDKRAALLLREVSREQPASSESLRAYAALHRLGEKAEPQTSVAVHASLISSNPEERSAGLEALVTQGAEAARPALEKAARDPDRQVRLKVIELASALAQELGDGRAASLGLSLTLLRRLIHDADVAVRARASALLGSITNMSAAASSAAEVNASARPNAHKTAGQPQVHGNSSADFASASTKSAAADESAEIAQTSKLHGAKADEPAKKIDRSAARQLLQSASESFSGKDYRTAQKALERLFRLCDRAPRQVCAPLVYELSYYLGRSYEAQGQLAEAMNEFQRLDGKRGGNAAERAYLADATLRLSKKLGRVQIQRRNKKGRCQTMTMWVTPGEQEIRISATETNTVRVGANQKTSVGACP